MKFIRIGIWVFFAALFAGCQTASKPDYTPTRAVFYLETAGDGRSVQVTLPVSGLTLAVQTNPVITEYDLGTVAIAKTELGECLRFQLKADARRDVYRLTAANQGGRLVLFLNGVATGATRIAGPVEDGVISVYVEKPDAALPALVRNLQLTSVALQREMARK